MCFDRNINGKRDVKILECDYLSVQRCVKLTLVGYYYSNSFYLQHKLSFWIGSKLFWYVVRMPFGHLQKVKYEWKFCSSLYSCFPHKHSLWNKLFKVTLFNSNPEKPNWNWKMYWISFPRPKNPCIFGSRSSFWWVILGIHVLNRAKIIQVCLI